MKKTNIFLLFATIATGTSFSCTAKDWHNEPLTKIEKAAENGNKEAQETLAWAYYAEMFNPTTGEYIHKDYEKAAYWCNKLVRQPNAKYEQELGYIYLNEINGDKKFRKDLKQSAYWFEQSATHGDLDSQYIIGRIYINGEGVPKNLNKAFEWFKKSAKQGHGDAIYALSTFYFDGVVVERDYIKSMALAMIAKKHKVSTVTWADEIIIKSLSNLDLNEQAKARSLKLNDII